ncbi:MAG: haloacid dehalogenase-like hydrolase [Rhodomicrobium sp.]
MRREARSFPHRKGGLSRTGLRRTKTEIGKWRAETAALKPAAAGLKFEDCAPETAAKKPKPRKYRSFSQTGESSHRDQTGWLSKLDEAVDALEIDPTFPAFTQFCSAAGIELIVVSDGVDYFIRRMLQRAGLGRLPVRANRLIHRGQRRYSLGHPHRVQGCASAAGTCKCTRAAAECSGHRTVLIGDGRSDFCVSHKADIVFAKKSLLGYTQPKGIKALEYSNFDEVRAALETLLPLRRHQAAFANAGLIAA